MSDVKRILLADDHPVIRKGLRGAVEEDDTFQVVAEVADGEAALAALQQFQVEVAVLDIDMPKLDGLAVLRKMKQLGLPVKVIFLTVHTSKDLFEEAMNLGAQGYILKDSVMEEIVVGLHAVCDGRSFLSSTMASYLLQGRKDVKEKDKLSLCKDLSASERRILKMIADGQSSKDIADEIGIHYRTVENHRTNICRKLGLEGANGLLRFALQNRVYFEAL